MRDNRVVIGTDSCWIGVSRRQVDVVTDGGSLPLAHSVPEDGHGGADQGVCGGELYLERR